MENDANEYQESTAITFEWTVRGLKHLFDSSKGDTKSKVTKSAKFGGGRWQILLYPNSGHEGGYVSLYLSCEPTQEEKENAVNGKWVREGLYKFSFDLKSTNKASPLVFNTKEACDHAFSWKTMNWGWAQFAKRDAVYYSTPAVRSADAFLIACTITSSPTPPTAPSPILRQHVPRTLMDSIGSMLNDPIYSDVEFVLPSRSRRGTRKIYASKKIICRAEYFASMFNSGFAEASSDHDSMTLDAMRNASPQMGNGPSEITDDIMAFDDSDESDVETMTDSSHTKPSVATLSPRYSHESDQVAEQHGDMETESDTGTGVLVNPSGAEEDMRDDGQNATQNEEMLAVVPQAAGSSGNEVINIGSPAEEQITSGKGVNQVVVPGPAKTRVHVKDVAYATYLAFLYYLYTDSIIFAPLSSNFMTGTINLGGISAPITPALHASGSQLSYFSTLPSGTANQLLPSRPRSALAATGAIQANEDGSQRTRRDWVKDWVASNPGRPGPVSAKAVYKLADKLNLQDLKQRAFQHIVKGLTVQNIPYEVFSSFSAAFEEVRRVEVDFFLNHWAEIRGGDAMRNVFNQIRHGRHPGFDEIWPLIVVNLEYRPRISEPPSNSTIEQRENRPMIGDA